MIWDKQARESYPAFQAFQVFLASRSYPAVAQEVSKSLTLIKRWAKRHQWRERADAWDSEVNRKAMDKAADDFAAMIELQIKVGRMTQVKAANAIQQMDFSSLPPKYLTALTNLLLSGAKLERSARALKHDEPQENLFVSTLAKIQQRIEDDD